jgi:CheY-like chemotaxis protein
MSTVVRCREVDDWFARFVAAFAHALVELDARISSNMRSAANMPQVFRVGLCGATLSDRILLRAVFGHHQVTQRFALVLTEPTEYHCDVAIVFESGAGASARWQALRARNPGLAAVLVGEAERPGTTNYVTRRYLVLRIRQMLDALIAARIGGTAQRVVAMPQRVTHEPRAQAVATEPAAVAAFTGRVLIVDDSAVARAQAGEQMAKIGFERLAASNAEQALRVIERGGVDLILLDVEMPGMDGYALCRKLKHEHQWRSIPVVMLTSHGLPFDRARGAFAGCDGYLTKPLADAELKTTLERLREKIARWRAVQPKAHTAS